MSAPASRDRILQIAPDLALMFRRDGNVEISRESGGRHVGTPLVLAALAAFRQPATLQEGVERLGRQVSGASEWADAANTVRALADAGLLVSPGDATAKAGTVGGSQSFDSAPVHIRMLND